MVTPSDYTTLFSSAALTKEPSKLKELDYVARVALTNRALYLIVQRSVCVPWPIIAAIHFRESDQHFGCHLHNGDPLTSRTVHVPAGRPSTGKPPFLWTESACDALKTAWKPQMWDIASCLEFMERYNGTGYQKHSVNTPYLWDYTDKYVSGLYVSDGSFDPDAKESRPGTVSLLKTLAGKGVSLDFASLGDAGSLLH